LFPTYRGCRKKGSWEDGITGKNIIVTKIKEKKSRPGLKNF
jgi:hypothetical protein